MGREATERELVVVNAKGQRATIIAVPNPSRSAMDDSEAELIYGMYGLVVERISGMNFGTSRARSGSSTELLARNRYL